ncbi:MAG TPA: hypothetical protein VMV02_03510 [Acidimicrobiales bacterium]|nr:hypothetical protein [Acidimicrobiales bacterium]
MEDLPGDVRLDARAVVEQLRALVSNAPRAYPGQWFPQATFDELLVRADREPIHLHPSLHHLHRHWDMGHARTQAGTGWGPKALGRRLLARVVNAALDRYLAEEQEFRAALAQSIDAIAYRVDEIASADLRAVLEIVRSDLLDLTRYIDDRIDTRLGDA